MAGEPRNSYTDGVDFVDRPDRLDNGADNDWAAKTTSSIVQYVGQVRDKTTGPALVASRVTVYILAIASVAAVLGVILLLLLFRFLVVATGELLPFVEPNESWLAHFILGGIFLGAGVFLWRKRNLYT